MIFCFSVLFSRILLRMIIKKAKIPNTKPIHGLYEAPLATIIHPPKVVPKVTPRFPKEVAKLLANSRESGTEEIIYVDAFWKLGEYRKPQMAMLMILAGRLSPEKYSKKGIITVPERNKAVVLATFQLSIFPAIQLAATPMIPKRKSI